MPKDMKEAGHRQDRERRRGSAARRSGSGARLQRRATADSIIRTNTEVPFSYIKDIDFQTMAKFSEHDVGSAGRRYRDQAGALVRLRRARVAPARLRRRAGRHEQGAKRRSSPSIRPTWTGNRTSRKRWTNICAANRASRYLRRNAKGEIDGVLREDPPQAGRNVYLTLDARIQIDRRGGAARRSGAARRWWSIRITATFWRWPRCRRSTRILLSRASRRRIGKRCARTKPIR